VGSVTVKELLGLVAFVVLLVALVVAIPAAYKYGSPWTGAIVTVIGAVVIARAARRHLS
jgi:hypothetical protein